MLWSIAIRHANDLLAKLEITIRDAIDQASSMFQVEGNSEKSGNKSDLIKGIEEHKAKTMQ